MTYGQGRLVRVGVAAGAVLAAFMTFPSASADTPSSVKGFGSYTQFTDQATVTNLTACSNQFTGTVTGDSAGAIEASITSASFTCQSGTAVTANGLPWTLNLKEDESYTINGFDVAITTRLGTCRYSGGVRGDMEFPGGVYTLTGLLSRQSAGCGGSASVAVADFAEVINAS